MDKTIKVLTDKMVDFKRFGITLLTVGVFFYLGVIIPTTDKAQLFDEAMMISCITFLGVSIYFFNKSRNLKKQIEEQAEE